MIAPVGEGVSKLRSRITLSVETKEEVRERVDSIEWVSEDKTYFPR